MGRRRRKVVRFPKKRLPKTFMCPNCGYKSVIVNIENIPESIRVQCGICGEIILKKIWEKETNIDCFNCKRNIARVSTSNRIIKITCEICGVTNFFEVTDKWMSFNCRCPPSKQSRFQIREGERRAIIKCGRCGLRADLKARKTDKEIDIYNRFFDDYQEGIPVIVRGETHV